MEGAPASQEATPASQEETPVSQEESPAIQQEPAASQEETPASQEETPASQEDTPASQEDTLASQTRFQPARQPLGFQSLGKTYWQHLVQLSESRRHGQMLFKSRGAMYGGGIGRKTLAGNPK